MTLVCDGAPPYASGMQTRHNGRLWFLVILMALLCVVAWPMRADDTAVMDPEQPVAVEAGESATPDEATEDYAAYVGWIELSGVLREGPAPFAWVSEAEMGPSLKSVIEQINHVAGSDDHGGMVLYLDQPMISFAQAGALRRAILDARDAGKTVMCFAEVYSTLDYYLASAADTVLLQRKGQVELAGLAVEEMYLAGLLDKIGVKADLLQVGKYKGADEQLVRDAPSPEWDENIAGLLDGLYGHIVSTIAQSRAMSVEALESAMADSLVLTDEALLERGLVDQLVSRDLLGATEPVFGEDFAWDLELGQAGAGAMPDNPFALFSMLIETPDTVTRRDTIAVIHAYGPIFSGESTIGDGLFSDASIGSATVVRALADALYDDNIKGVVLRIDSPGGSALASEVIWQGMDELRVDKPVYASVGGMAASGGYYIVCGATRVYVEPTTIVGSIGVVGGKLVMAGLYDWAGVSITRRSRGPLGDLFNSVEPFTDDQRAMVRESMTTIYEQFRDRVRTGRGARLPDLDAVDEGMLFTGDQAVANGMADHVGGLEIALHDLADELGLEDGQYDVINLPGPLSLADYLDNIFGVRGPAVQSPANHPAVTALRRVLGPQRWAQTAALLDGLTQLQHERALLLHPSVVSVTTGASR